MWSNHDKNNDNNIPAREFYTPPASWKSSAHSSAGVLMPMSERKTGTCKRDLFHVVHKVPSGDSPYVRAKHVQLIDKDPSKAISLFWAAINAGDRVDSALKDMALVMKQLDRSDEAIEAIKSFRHLCAYDSQESLDNVLVELYKRSGRIEEEIDMLQRKLKNIEDGIAFGGKKTKTARSQGKKVQITVEQEKSRILGNLAWAYLQHHDYGLAEQHYSKALTLEPDFNKQCNLALCLLHMNRPHEAKSLLQAVSSASRGSKEMDESYAKSFERAVEMLNEFELHSLLKPTEADENQRSMASHAISWSRSWENKENKGPSVPEKSNEGSYCENQRNFFEHNRGGSKCIPSQHSGIHNDWRKGHCFDSTAKRPGFSCKMKENGIRESEKQAGFARKEMFDSPAAVLYTQPRRGSGIFGEASQRKVRWEDNTIGRPTSKNLLAHAIDKLPLNLHESGSVLLSKSRSCLVSPAGTNWRGRPQTEVAQVNKTRVVAHDPFSQPRTEEHKSRWRSYSGENGDRMNSEEEEDQTMVVEEFEDSIAKGNNKVKSTYPFMNNSIGSKTTAKPASKSWADMVEEDENNLSTGEDMSRYLDSCWNYEEKRTDENLDSNLLHKSPIESISQKLETFDLRHGYDTLSSSGSPRKTTVRRSLCFDSRKDSPAKKKNRLQVFQDITPNPDSP